MKPSRAATLAATALTGLGLAVTSRHRRTPMT